MGVPNVPGLVGTLHGNIQIVDLVILIRNEYATDVFIVKIPPELNIFKTFFFHDKVPSNLRNADS